MASGGFDGDTGSAFFGAPVPDVALVVVTANPGAGKTMLLRQWYQHELGRSDQDVVWFEVEAADNDPGHLEARLEPLIGSRERPTIVFVDDFEVVQSLESRQVMVALVEQRLGYGRFVLAQRQPSRLPVARLRADDLVVEISDAELRLDGRNVERLMARRRLTVSEPGLSRLLEDTEGWAKGIVTVLDRLAGTTGQPEDEVINRALADLATEMVEIIEYAVNDDDFEYLVGTSILDELETGLCREVLSVNTAIDVERLAARTPFIGRVGGDARRLRLHRLARRGLQTVLAIREDPDALAGRHTAAANWLEANGEIVAALGHSLAARLPERAADLLAVRWSIDPTAVGRHDLDSVGAAAVRPYVPHIVTTALVSKRVGDRARLQGAIDRLETANWVGPLPHGFATLDSAIVSLRGSLSRQSGVAELEEFVEVVTRDEISGGEPRRLIVLSNAAFAAHLLGQFDEALRLADLILLGHRSVGRHTMADRIATVRASDLRALLEADLGNMAEARRHLRHSDGLAASYGLPTQTGKITPAPRGRVLVRAVVGDASVDVRIAELVRVCSEGFPLVQLYAAIELVRLLDRDRQVEEALDVLDRTRASVVDDNLPPLLSQRLDLLDEALRPRRRRFGPDAAITVAERSVLYLLADKSLGQREISVRLELSVNTIKSHLRSIYQKFGVTGRAEAVTYAADRGLLVTVLPWGRPDGPVGK